MGKIYIIVCLVLFFSCNQNEKKQDATNAVVPEKASVPEDTVNTRLRYVVLEIETKELQSINVLKQIAVDSVQYKMISLKEYYSIQKEALTKGLRFSTNKEKTNKALAYLDKMTHNSSAEQNIYCVQFHLNARLASAVVYNEQHIKYLKKDMTEIQLRFP